MYLLCGPEVIFLNLLSEGELGSTSASRVGRDLPICKAGCIVLSLDCTNNMSFAWTLFTFCFQFFFFSELSIFLIIYYE